MTVPRPSRPLEPAKNQEHRPDRDTAGTVALVVLIALAAALRVWRLGHWGLEGDEVFTFRDSVHPQLDNPRPLMYFLNYFVVRPLIPLDELGLRLLPAVSGILAVPALYLVTRRLAGVRAALFAALLLAFNPMHVYQSQYARYWSLVFLLSAVYPFAVFLGLRDRDRRMLTIGILTTILAVLAHPVSLLLAGGLGIWFLSQLRREQVTRFWDQKAVRWAMGVSLVLAAVVAVRYLPMLSEWVFSHDDKARIPDHLLTLPGGGGVKQMGLLLSYVDGLTLPLALTGTLGVYLLWRRDRSLALLLTCLFVVPVGFIVLLSFRTAVSTTYIISTAPVFFIGSGVFLDRLAGVDWELRPRWLVSAAVAVMILGAGLPTLVSQYRDGRRQDFRGAARWLEGHLAPGDVLFSDQFRTVRHYLPRTDVQHLSADPTPFVQSLDTLRTLGHGGALWIVAPHTLRGGYRTNPKLDRFKSWINDNCRLRNAIGVARLDFRQNELEIYRCSPGASTAP